MLYLRHPTSFEHDTGPHPENATRLRAIEDAMEREGWLGLELVEAPAAIREQLERVHASRYVDSIEEFCRAGGGMLDIDTAASEGSWEAALHAAGGAVHAVDRLLGSGDDSFAFCALRPPGHHADTARAGGFCLFNNIAVAAAHALEEHGAERVAIVDWDVHHGNGTEAIFYDSDRVLYASIHQSPLYPGSGAAEDVGSGAGEGFTINLPVPPGSGSDEFLSLIQHVIAPAVREHRPALIGVSAGYDAHRDDPLAGCLLDAEAYADMAASLRELAAELGVPVLVCLEGGYDLDALASSVVATIAAFTSSAPPRAAPVALAEPYLSRVRSYWPAL